MCSTTSTLSFFYRVYHSHIEQTWLEILTFNVNINVYLKENYAGENLLKGKTIPYLILTFKGPTCNILHGRKHGPKDQRVIYYTERSASFNMFLSQFSCTDAYFIRLVFLRKTEKVLNITVKVFVNNL